MRQLRYSDLEKYTERAMQMLDKDIVELSKQFAIWGHTPEEVAQELRWQIFRKIHLYDPTKASIRTWGVSVCRRRLIDMDRVGNKKNVDVLNTMRWVPLEVEDSGTGEEGHWFTADFDENILALQMRDEW